MPKPIHISIDPPPTHCEIEFVEDFAKLEKKIRAQIGNRKFLVVTDSNVAKFSKFPKQFKKNLFILSAQNKKDWKAVNEILKECFERDLDRNSVLVAIGGGTMGDIVGFASSIFMRGIAFLQVPTSLLAQVDASIGGKNGIDYTYGKNLIGTIHQPEKIYNCDEFLLTLPESEIRNGLAEMIKHGIIASPTHFKHLEKIASSPPDIRKIIPLIRESIEIKACIVERDERDHHVRIQLNLGHTFGHAIEMLSKYKISHGQAVAIGTMMATNFAVQHGICSEKVADRIENLFHKFRIDILCDFDEKRIWEAMKHDKKCVDGHVRLVLPKAIGEVEVVLI